MTELTKETVSPPPLNRNINVAFAVAFGLMLLIGAFGMVFMTMPNDPPRYAPNAAPSILPTVIVHDSHLTGDATATIGRSDRPTYLIGKLVLHGRCGDITLDASGDHPNIYIAESDEGSACALPKPIDLSGSGLRLSGF